MFVNHFNLSHIKPFEFLPKETLSHDGAISHTENDVEEIESASLENHISFGQSLRNNISSYNNTIKNLYRKTFSSEVSSDSEKADSLSSIVKIVEPSSKVLDFPPIEKEKISHGSSVLNKIKKLYDKIRNSFVLNVIVGPKLNEFISKQLKEIKFENYKSNYPTLLDSTHQFMNELKEKFGVASSFGERDLHRLQLKLANHVNKILYKNKIPSISKEEFKVQSIDFKLREIAKEKSIPSELSKLLTSIEPEDMPIDLLSKIEWNGENESILIDTWKRVIENLPIIGSLDRLNTHKLRSEAPLRITCAIKLLEAIKYAPKSKNGELDQLLEMYSKETSSLEDFIVHENSLLKVPVNLNCLKLLSKEKEYTENIKPHIEQLVQKLRSEDDAYSLILKLMDKKTCQKIQNAIKKVSFSSKSIENMFIKELEILASEEFKLTNTQLKNLRSQREKINEGVIKRFLQSFKECYQEHKPKAPLENSLIFGENVTKKIREKGYNHPSQIQDKALIALINLTNARDVSAANIELSENEKQEFIEALQTLSTVPHILEILKKFKKQGDKGVKGELEKNDGSLKDSLGLFYSIYKKMNPSKIEEYYKVPAGVDTETIKMVRKYFKMKETFLEVEKPIAKALVLLAKYKNNPEAISKSEQLNLEEIGKIFAFTKFKSSINIYKKLGVELHPEIKNLIKAVEEAEAIVEELQKILIPVMKKHYHSGDIFAYKGAFKAQWHGKNALMGLDKLANEFCGGYTHGMKVCHNQNGELRTSEIAYNYEQPTVRIYDVAISDILRLDLDKLIPKSSLIKFKEVLGENWKEKLQKEYIKIEENIHWVQSKNYKKITNSGTKRAYAGMSSWKRFFSLIKPVTGLNVPGHRLDDEQDYRELYEKFMSGKIIKEELICSEFTAKSTLVAIMKLNKVMNRFIVKKHPELQASKIHGNLVEKGIKISKHVESYLNGERHFGLKRHVTKKAERDLIRILRKQGFSKNTIDSMIRFNNEEMIDLPFDKKERLEALHPGRMVKLLKDKKYVTQVTIPKEFQNLINFS